MSYLSCRCPGASWENTSLSLFLRSLLYEFARALLTNYRRLGSSDYRHLLSQFWRLEDQGVSRAGTFSGHEGECPMRENVPGLSPSFRWFAGILICARITSLAAFRFTWHYPVHIYLHPNLKDSSHNGLGAHSTPV